MKDLAASLAKPYLLLLDTFATCLNQHLTNKFTNLANVTDNRSQGPAAFSSSNLCLPSSFISSFLVYLFMDRF